MIVLYIEQNVNFMWQSCIYVNVKNEHMKICEKLTKNCFAVRMEWGCLYPPSGCFYCTNIQLSFFSVFSSLHWPFSFGQAKKSNQIITLRAVSRLSSG